MRSTPVPDPPPLTDDVVTLRPRRADDVAVLAVAARDPETRRWLDDEPADPDDVEGSLRRSTAAYASGRSAPLVIADAATDAPWGLVNLQFRDDRVATLAYSVLPAARGRGVAGRAVALVGQWAFGALALAQLRLEIDPENTASVRVAEKSGWRLLPDVRTTEGKLVFVSHPATTGAAPQWRAVTVDAVDVPLVAGFWMTLLDGDLREAMPGWAQVGSLANGLVLTVQPVPEPKATKNRLHLDLYTDDLARTTRAVERLGGRATGERHEYPEGVVQVIIDPEGNEFCLVQLVEGASPG